MQPRHPQDGTSARSGQNGQIEFRQRARLALDEQAVEMSAPIMRRGWTQFSPATHSLAYSAGNTPEAYARSREQLFHFVETWAKSGTGEIR